MHAPRSERADLRAKTSPMALDSQVTQIVLALTEQGIPGFTAANQDGGSSSALWAAFDSLAGDEVADGIAVPLDFATSFIGAGTLTSCTVGVVGGDPAILLPDVGCYLVTANVQPPSFAFGDVSAVAQFEAEVQVFNSESDPFFYTNKGSNDAFVKPGVLTAVINVLESDDPLLNRGFAFPVRARGTTFTPPANFVALKVVQLATT